MVLTLDLPDDLAAKLKTHSDELPRLLELGLREIKAASPGGGFSGVADVLEALAGLPTPEEILELRPASKLAQRMDELLEKNRDRGLSADEEREWERYQYLEHVVRLAKSRALAKLRGAEAA